ncbi:hypothetical protein J5Y04_16495 [Kitasatospora sp. RG8]|nr:hypothetical protein [Kitasatospora sp. RG8]
MTEGPLARFTLDLDNLRAMLGLDEDATPRAVVRAARPVSPGFAAVALSVAEADGHTLGSGSRDEVSRARGRIARYEQVAAAAARTGAARVVKGPSLARWYPRPLVRSMCDLDLLVPDEAALWRVVRGIAAEYSPDLLYVSVLARGPVRDLVATLCWPAPDPLLDADLKIEVATLVHAGDLRHVPVRAGAPTDPGVANLLALAEERFQHPFGVKDAIDVAVLLGSPDAPDPAEVVAAAREYLLAPELLELVEYACARPRLLTEPAPALMEPLRDAARAETERRAGSTPVTPADGDGDGDGDVRRRMALGLPVHGLHLRDADHPGRQVARIEDFDSGVLLRAPVADFLLVGQELVDEQLYRAALAFLEKGRDAQSTDREEDRPW